MKFTVCLFFCHGGVLSVRASGEALVLWLYQAFKQNMNEYVRVDVSLKDKLASTNYPFCVFLRPCIIIASNKAWVHVCSAGFDVKFRYLFTCRWDIDTNPSRSMWSFPLGTAESAFVFVCLRMYGCVLVKDTLWGRVSRCKSSGAAALTGESISCPPLSDHIHRTRTQHPLPASIRRHLICHRLSHLSVTA